MSADTPTQPRMTYREACKQAIRAAILADPRVFLMGEDVGRYGGCYAVTKGLIDELGEDRMRDRPLTDATITVTSLGDRGAEVVLQIIHPPQVAMIGIGRVVTRPWVVGDTIAPRPVVTLTLAGDHPASDGHRGGLLLAGIDRHLQEAESL